MKISEIPGLASEYGNDYIFALSTFLDEFYHSTNEERLTLLSEEPPSGMLTQRQYCSLAAAAHKLANDYQIPVPSWVMKEEYIMPHPIYAFETTQESDQDYLKNDSFYEYKIRNLFYGSNVLKRV